jgi:hypothetical protein
MTSMMQKYYPTLLPFTGKYYPCGKTNRFLFLDDCLEVQTVLPHSNSIIVRDTLTGEEFDLFCSALEQSCAVSNRPDEDFHLNLDEAYICYKD